MTQGTKGLSAQSASASTVAASSRKSGGRRAPEMVGLMCTAKLWTVTLMRNGVFHRKAFALSRWGEHGALAQAQAWRDQVMADHPEIGQWRAIEAIFSHTEPGGVVCIRDADGTPRGWLAQTPLGHGVTARKTFSLVRHGKAARDKAIAERESQLRRMVAGFASRADGQSAETMSKFVRHANPMYGICERDTYWRVHLQRNGKSFTRTFSYLKYGGRELALTLAAAWRDQITHDHPQLERRELAHRLRRNNTSGIAGVRCRMGPDGKPLLWTASTRTGPGKVSEKSFSVTKYGDEAMTMAIAERLRQLAQLEGRTSRHPADRVEAANTIRHDEIEAATAFAVRL